MIVVGSVNTDMYLKVDHLPASGKTAISTRSSLYPGGKGINQSVGAAKLGARVSLIGAVGNDVDSDRIYAALREHSVNSAGVRRCGDASTGKAFIFVQKDGDSMISILAGANGSLNAADIDRNIRVFENCSYCLVSTEIPEDVVLASLKAAKMHQTTTILKPSTIQTISDEILRYVDILIPNNEEICDLCPEGTLREKAEHFLKKGVKSVIVTLGQNGSYLKEADKEAYFPAQKFQSVDNTGACDAFISALAVYLQSGYDIEKAIRIATYAAGFSITREGVYNALVDRSTLESYLTQQDPELLN